MTPVTGWGDNHPVIITRQDYSSKMFAFFNHPVIITDMPNSRKKGTKLAGAYIPDEKNDALAKLAKSKGYPDKAEFIRALYDLVLEGKISEDDLPKAKP